MNNGFSKDFPEPEEYRLARERLVAQLRHSGIKDELVLQAILKVPRHLFMEERLRYRAYEDVALPIEEEQTISQPYIVARMTETLIQGRHLDSVLEIGTGSGYQAAILAQLVDKVYSIERIEVLYQLCKSRFRALNIRNVELHYGDGYQGLKQAAPFQGIIVTAASKGIPKPLLEQLAEGGRLVLPVGNQGVQQLRLIERKGNDFHSEYMEGVRFVPLLPGVK